MNVEIDPEWLKMLIEQEDRLIEEFKKLVPNGQYLGWTAQEMDIPWQQANMLVRYKLARVSYKSNKYTMYMLNRENIEKYLAMQEEIKNAQQNPAIPDDLFGSIIGYDDIKELLKAVIKNGERYGALFVGPPASAKTMFLMELLRLPNSVFITAYTTTKAGLRDLFINENPKYIAIDEIDKAPFETITTLLSALENGIVVKTTSTNHITAKVEPIIFASSNNLNKINSTIRSRFQVFNLKPYTYDQLKEIGKMLFKREGISEEYIDNYVNMALEKGVIEDPRDFVKIARVLKVNNNIENVLNTLIKYK